MDTILMLAVSFGSLVGVSALIAALLNLLKTLGVIPDGQAGRWSALFNLGGLVALILLGVFEPSLGLEFVDERAGQVAQVLVIVSGYLLQIVSSSGAHAQLSGMRIPIIGKSNSQ